MRSRKIRRPSQSGRAPAYRPKYSPPKKPTQFRNIVRPIIYFVVACLIFWWVFMSGFFTVKNILVKGNSTVASGEVAKQLNGIMKSSILGQNIIFLNTDKLAKQFAEKNPQLGDIKVRKRLLNGIEITIVERQPSLLWKSGNSMFVLSEDGRAYSQWNGGSTDLSIVTDNANLPVKINQQVVPASFITFTRQLISQLNSQKINYVSLSVPETTSELYVKTKTGYTIKFDSTRPVDEQMTDLKAVLASLAKQKKQPSEYIDLRISSKVFYK